MQFVLRLRPDVHKALMAAPAGLVTQQDLTEDQILAFSTYLHETIHWWQHVGSTSGLLLSLLYPAQAHLAHDDLMKLLATIGPIKSLRELNANEELKASLPPAAVTQINVALNNWHDVEFCKWLIIDPVGFEARSRDVYFESAGHSYSVTLAAVMSIIAATLDPKREFLPDSETWGPKYAALRARKEPNFFYGSDLSLPGIGVRDIFEGQARLSQLQYLAGASGNRLTWSHFRSEGMLQGVYGRAFDHFARATEITVPEELDAPVFGLFLLVCDIALNPVEGLIIDFQNYDDVITTFDPGWRFLQLCFVIGAAPEKFERAIKKYSRDEYFQVSEQLCSVLNFLAPRALAERVTIWSQQQPQVLSLLDEDRTFEFLQPNLPVRVFMARFIRLQMEKANHPQFFCWPGISMTPDRAHDIPPETALALFEEHRALFLDREDGDVYPRTFTDRDESVVHAVFNDFYGWVCTYDFTRQWLVGTGPFIFDFSWLTSKHTESEMVQWATRHFKVAYGRDPSEYSILSAKEA